MANISYAYNLRIDQFKKKIIRYVITKFMGPPLNAWNLTRIANSYLNILPLTMILKILIFYTREKSIISRRTSCKER